MTTYDLWQDGFMPFDNKTGERPVLEYYPAENKTTGATVVIFPGGGYMFRSVWEGDGYARYLNAHGMDAFVCEYRVCPNAYPSQLADAREAVRFVRSRASEFGIDPGRIAVMGSSAGGHLAAVVSAFRGEIPGEETPNAGVSPYPDASVLCYPVIHTVDEKDEPVRGCFMCILGDKDHEEFYADRLVTDETPRAFIWTTFDDSSVDIRNSYLYASALAAHGIPHELHVFQSGEHGLGLAEGVPHLSVWPELMMKWFRQIGFTEQ